ncbi:MAG: FtsX-like permease family protein [Bacteroidia bacterium]|nr:FtsX-like permease family protein [Bacteroidia bacterium]
MISHIFKLIWNRKRQNSLLILEIFFAFLILFAVLGVVFFNLDRYRQPLGFETENIWVVYFTLPPGTDSSLLVNTKKQLKTTLKQFPEIEQLSYSSHITPFSNSNSVSTNDHSGFSLQTWLCEADEDFAETMGLKLVAGRWPNAADYDGKYTPVVINQLLLDTYFKDSSMVDKIFSFNGENKIVGVVEHYKYLGEFAKENPLTFFPFREDDLQSPALSIRLVPGTSADFEEKLNRTVQAITKDWEFAIEHYETRRVRNSQEVWIPLVALLVICTFLLVNIAMGLFGVLIYNVSRRRPEIGLRMAMGASSGSIVRQFMLELFFLTGLGLVLGVFFAVQVPLLKLFDVPVSIYLYAGFGAMFIIFTLVGLCTLYPSQQASRIHPAIALHEE